MSGSRFWVLKANEIIIKSDSYCTVLSSTVLILSPQQLYRPNILSSKALIFSAQWLYTLLRSFSCPNVHSPNSSVDLTFATRIVQLF